MLKRHHVATVALMAILATAIAVWFFAHRIDDCVHCGEAALIKHSIDTGLTVEQAIILVRTHIESGKAGSPYFIETPMIYKGDYFFPRGESKLRKVRIHGYLVNPQTRQVRWIETSRYVRRSGELGRQGVSEVRQQREDLKVPDREE